MVDSELLSAISNLLDEKLKPIEERLDRIENRMDKLDGRIVALEKCVSKLAGNVIKLDTYVKKLNSTVEVDVAPRLRTIESCYLDTYKRYQLSTDKITDMETDVEVLKATVHDHGLKLMMIS